MSMGGANGRSIKGFPAQEMGELMISTGEGE